MTARTKAYTIRTGMAVKMCTMGPRYFPQRTLLYVALLFLPFYSAFAQTFTGRCQVTSVPFQVRAEGLAERLGDINLRCSGGVPGSVLSGNFTLLLPVNVTNRVDANNQTFDAVLAVDSGSGFAATTIPGQV